MSNDEEVTDLTETQDPVSEHDDEEHTRAVALRSAPIDQIRNQAKDVQNLLENLMEPREHYGKFFEGQNKPALLQPGAEKLCSAFGMTPRYDVETIDITAEDIPWGHREVRVTCSLYTRGDQIFLGQGVGVCTTLEPKYRYRKAEEVTGVSVPSEFWDSGDSNAERDFDILRAALDGVEEVPDEAMLGTEKTEKGWRISYRSGQMENPDPAAEWNTVTKMAKKRALVDAVKTATAASDIFTQDVEDFPEEKFAGEQQQNGNRKPLRDEGNQNSGKGQRGPSTESRKTQRSGGSGTPQTSQNQPGSSQRRTASKEQSDEESYRRGINNIRTRLEEKQEEEGGDMAGAVGAALSFIANWPPKYWHQAADVIREFVPADAEIKVPDQAPTE